MQIFISYSRKNRETAKILAQDMQELGHNVWLDQELTGGQTWWDQILSKIRRCDVFVFVLAPEALSSTACKREYIYADRLRRRILPVLVADVSTNLVPPELSKIQFVDYRRQDKQEALSLNKALLLLPPSQPLPDPLPKAPEVPVSYLSNLKDEIEIGLPPDFGGQIALVYKLKDHLNNEDEYNDARRLLEELKGHGDILARVAKEIDVVLASTASTFPPEPGIARQGTKSNAVPQKPGVVRQSTKSDAVPEKAGPLRWVKIGAAILIGFVAVLFFLLSAASNGEPYSACIGLGLVVGAILLFRSK